ncbi:hypothetical protein DFJ74DRAFT_670524 [Hyaloraphidium curvatum]|nr:hypothetical protein DFJ74DRAFT_670524 [Hyaloraphidium curvatum]
MPSRKNLPTLSVGLAALLLASLVAPARSVAVPGGGAALVIYRRGCGECPEEAYCEFGYPGAPEGHVACVANEIEASHQLYRRYTQLDSCTASAGRSLVVAKIGDGTFDITQNTSAPLTLDFLNPCDFSVRRTLAFDTTGSNAFTTWGTPRPNSALIHSPSLASGEESTFLLVPGYPKESGDAGTGTEADSVAAVVVDPDGTVRIRFTFGPAWGMGRGITGAFPYKGNDGSWRFVGSGLDGLVSCKLDGTGYEVVPVAGQDARGFAEDDRAPIWTTAGRSGLRFIFPAYRSSTPSNGASPLSGRNGAQFLFWQSTEGGAYDTLYFADINAASASPSFGGVQKWTRTATSPEAWTRQARFFPSTTAAGCRGLAVYRNGTDVVILTTTAETAPNRLIQFIDTGYTGDTAVTDFEVKVPASPGIALQGLAWIVQE